MARLHIELPDELHRKAKLQAIKNQQTLAQTIIEVLEKRL